MGKKAMVIAPFSSWMDWERKEMFPEKRQLLESIIDTLESYGYDVLSAHRRESWGRDWWPADECTKLDYQWVENADLVVALPGDPASGGVHMELGWSSAHGKNLAVLIENNRKYSPLVHGLGAAFENVTYIKYRNQAECLEALTDYLDTIGQKAKKNPLLRRASRLLPIAASLVLAVGIGYLTKDYWSERQLQHSRVDVLRDYARGLFSGLGYSGEHGTVIIYGDRCVMYPTGWDPSKLRLYGLDVDAAQKKVMAQLANLNQSL